MAGYASGGKIALTCEFCFDTISPSDNFCFFCGKALNKEELLIKYYFIALRGFHYFKAVGSNIAKRDGSRWL